MADKTHEHNLEKNPIRGCLETAGLILLVVACIGFMIYGAIQDDMKFVGISLIFAFAMIVLYISYRRKMKENANVDISVDASLEESYKYLDTPITDKYAYNIYKAVHSFSEFLSFIHNRTDNFYEWLQSQHIASLKETDMLQKVHAMILSDIQTGYLSMGTPLNLKSREGFALYSLIDYFNTDKQYDFEDISNIEKDTIETAQVQAEEALNTFNPNHEEDKLVLLELLRKFDDESHQKRIMSSLRKKRHS